MTKQEYEEQLQERRELEDAFRSQIYEEWSNYLQELGLPENCGLWEA